MCALHLKKNIINSNTICTTIINAVFVIVITTIIFIDIIALERRSINEEEHKYVQKL